MPPAASRYGRLLPILLAGIALEVVALAYWEARSFRDCCCDNFSEWILGWSFISEFEWLYFLLLPAEHILRAVEVVFTLIRLPAEVLLENGLGLPNLSNLAPILIATELPLVVLLVWTVGPLWQWGKRRLANRPASSPAKPSTRHPLITVFKVPWQAFKWFFAGAVAWFILLPLAGGLSSAFTVKARSWVGLPLYVSTTVEQRTKPFEPSSYGLLPTEPVRQLLRMGQEKTEDAVVLQSALVRQHAPEWATIVSRRVCCEELPETVTCSEGEALTKKALAVINAFLGPVRDEKATGRLLLSADGKRASYDLSIGYYHGVLNGLWTYYYLEFEKTPKGWIVTKCRDDGSMAS